MISYDLYAFEWEKCRNSIPGGAQIFGFSTSTTSYISSIGDCAMTGLIDNDKKIFLVQNFENMKKDSSRGAGEYIEAYAIVSMCDQSVRREFYRAFQNNFTHIFYGDSVEKEPEQVYEEMERVMKMNSILASGCYPKV